MPSNFVGDLRDERVDLLRPADIGGDRLAVMPAADSDAIPSSRCSASEQMTTTAPSRPSERAAPRPIPRLPPVTNAMRPSNGFAAVITSILVS